MMRERFAHDDLLQRLRAAAAADQLDPVEWRRLRSPMEWEPPTPTQDI